MICTCREWAESSTSNAPSHETPLHVSDAMPNADSSMAQEDSKPTHNNHKHNHNHRHEHNDEYEQQHGHGHGYGHKTRRRCRRNRPYRFNASVPLLIVACWSLLSADNTAWSFPIAPVALAAAATMQPADSTSRLPTQTRALAVDLDAPAHPRAGRTPSPRRNGKAASRDASPDSQRRWLDLHFLRSHPQQVTGRRSELQPEEREVLLARLGYADDRAATATLPAPPKVGAIASQRQPHRQSEQTQARTWQQQRQQQQQSKGNLLTRYAERKEATRRLHLRGEYERRKTEWAGRYTDVKGLRSTFGRNRNRLWGDLDATTTRRLYKTLLPTAIMELWVQLDGIVSPEEVAPLAYQARKAAKLYARERSQLPYRVMAQTMDGIRTFQQYGRFQPSGLSYQQIWDKYREQAIASMEAGVEFSEGGDLTEDDVTAKICLKILEKSCATNPGVDKWLLSKPGATNGAGAMGHPDLEFITQQLERDVRKLLDTTTAQTEVQRRLSSPRGRWFGGGNEHDTAVTVDGDGDVASIDFESDSTGGGGNEGNEHGTNVQFETSSSGTATTSDTDHRNTNANTKANDDTVKADAPNARQQALALQKYRTWRAIAKAKRHAQTVYQNHASAPTSEVKIARTESPDLREDSTSDGPHEVDQHISERLAGEFRSAGASHHKQHWSNRSSRHRQRHNKRWTNRQQPSRNKD